MLTAHFPGRETALRRRSLKKTYQKRLKVFRLAGGANAAQAQTSNPLDSDSDSKSLILRQFQKSGREFTGFQEKCKAKSSARRACGTGEHLRGVRNSKAKGRG